MIDLPAPAATAARAIAATLLRHAITAAGTALVARGIVTQDIASSATGPIADYALGALLVAGSGAWSVLRARLTHTRWAAAWAILQGRDPAAPASATAPVSIEASPSVATAPVADNGG